MHIAKKGVKNKMEGKLRHFFEEPMIDKED